MSGLRDILTHPSVYRLWQAPFAGGKLRPVLEHNDVSAARRVLDVACGPGTNATHFAHTDYLGVDINPAYIASARRRHPGCRFEVADVTTYTAPADARFDFVLMNSFLHHVSDDDATRILRHVTGLLTDDGHVHVLDLVLPPTRGPARLLARLDRGDFPRPLERWRAMFEAVFEPVVFEPYPIGIGTMALWNMVYVKGRRRP